MKAFKARVKTGVKDGPLFGSNQPIVVAIQFMMKRPLAHFKGDKRSNELKTRAPLAHTCRPDLNNLSKFVLDGLNELVWPDDAQVVKLVVSKMYDNEGVCEGRTVVDVNRFAS